MNFSPTTGHGSQYLVLARLSDPDKAMDCRDFPVNPDVHITWRTVEQFLPGGTIPVAVPLATDVDGWREMAEHVSYFMREVGWKELRIAVLRAKHAAECRGYEGY